MLECLTKYLSLIRPNLELLEVWAVRDEQAFAKAYFTDETSFCSTLFSKLGLRDRSRTTSTKFGKLSLSVLQRLTSKYESPSSVALQRLHLGRVDQRGVRVGARRARALRGVRVAGRALGELLANCSLG